MRRSTPERSRSRCKGRRTRCASTAGERSDGRSARSPTPTCPARRPTACSSRSEAGRSRRASAPPSARPASTRSSTPCRPRVARRWRWRGTGRGGDEHPERRWAELMTPWPGPHSIADGILDDETYDWIGVFEAMRDCGGTPVVASEELIVRGPRAGVGDRHRRQPHRQRGSRRPAGDPRRGRRRRAGRGDLLRCRPLRDGPLARAGGLPGSLRACRTSRCHSP